MPAIPYWIVWQENGDAPTYKHQTQDRAEAEAQRLARMNPGRQYVVLCPTMRIMAQREFVERFDDIPF